ncbi:MAG: glycosyltransferase family 39 protein [Alphaproteobacteria bacterium]
MRPFWLVTIGLRGYDDRMRELFKTCGMQATLVFIAALLVIALQMAFQEKEIPYADNITYMAVALPLYETGIYEDGNFKNTVLPPGPNGEGMFFAPLYPAFLAGVMHFSEGLREAARCSIELVKPPLIEEQCALDFRILWGAQALLGALSALFIWLAALALFNDKRLAWLSAFLVVTLNNFAYYAGVVMAEALIMPLFYMACYGIILCWQKQSRGAALLTGLSFGALILTKPSFAYLAYFLATGFGGLGLYTLVKYKKTRALQCVFLAVAGAVLLTAPWIMRNHLKLDHAAVTFGYGPFTLSQRVAYNDMTMEEWLVSWIYGIPGEGDSIAEKLFRKESYERWSWGDPNGFYRQGNDVLRARTLEEAGGHDAHLSYLLKNYVIADLPKHIATTFPIIFRGMWVFELWVFIPYIAFIVLCLNGLKTRRYDYILYALAPWFMLGLHGFATVNIARYNIIMQGSLGIALAWGIIRLWERYRSKKTPAAGLSPVTG